MTIENNLFIDGKRIDTDNIRRGCKTTDVHAFIQNDLFRFLTEIQVNYEDDTKKPMMRSRLINLAIIDLIEILPGDNTVQCPFEVDSIADGGNQQQKADDSESRLDWMVFNCLQ